MKSQLGEIRMSPRYIKNMMMFKSFMTKTQPSINPVMLRIYGKLNAEREIINNQEIKQRPNTQRKRTKRAKINSDDKVLLLIQKDFERETKQIKKLGNHTAKTEELQQSIHNQLINKHSNSISSLINQDCDVKLAPSYYELLNTIQPEMNFKSKLTLREPLSKARALLSQTKEKKRIYESQIRHQRDFFRQPTLTDLPSFGKKRTTIKSIFEDPRNKIQAKQFINSISEHCKSESTECCKILHQCSKAQGKFNSHYEELLDNYFTQM
ncbi:unnamed protein product [Paramecium sonneborni]|uniref:Uncharacterized protein n=1 Tax=Paramecium sonneborni TaxID=65129 RepID=A0A8S1KTW3_9CILI|nr:unnamed protein product [Paramecium sonneborni]